MNQLIALVALQLAVGTAVERIGESSLSVMLMMDSLFGGFGQF